jgi:hypothetical protein
LIVHQEELLNYGHGGVEAARGNLNISYEVVEKEK